MANLKKFKFEIFLFLFLVFSFFLTFYTIGFPEGGDNFVGRVSFLTGQTGSEIFWPGRGFGWAFLRPLGPAMAAVISPLFGAYGAMLLEDLIFYLLTPFVFFYAANYFFQQKIIG